MPRTNFALLTGGLALASLVVVLLASNASNDPDGLERVARDQGFAGKARHASSRLLSGYSIPGVGNEALSTVLAGILGVVAVAVVGLLAGLGLRRRRHGNDADSTRTDRR